MLLNTSTALIMIRSFVRSSGRQSSIVSIVVSVFSQAKAVCSVRETADVQKSRCDSASAFAIRRRDALHVIDDEVLTRYDPHASMRTVLFTFVMRNAVQVLQQREAKLERLCEGHGRELNIVITSLQPVYTHRSTNPSIQAGALFHESNQRAPYVFHQHR